jgi:hypothetical protein
VNAVTEIPANAFSKGNLVRLWAGDDMALHASLLEELKAAELPYFDRPISAYSRRAFPNGFPATGTPLFGFEVAVFSSDLEMAKAILQKLGNDS